MCGVWLYHTRQDECVVRRSLRGLYEDAEEMWCLLQGDMDSPCSMYSSRCGRGYVVFVLESDGGVNSAVNRYLDGPCTVFGGSWCMYRVVFAS